MSTISDTRTVTSKSAERSILACFNKQRPVFLWGPPGIGKSELVEGIAKKNGWGFIDLRLAQMEPTDLRGIPYYNKDIGKMDWAEPIDLPDAELSAQYDKIILFLDEMNSAAPSIQAAAYQLILNRRVGKYKLPDNVVMIAAGNRESDKGVTYRMPAPLANRFIHLEMRVDHESWLDWAVTNRVHKDVVGYVSFAKSDLYSFDSRSASRSFATPRSWTFTSEILDDADLSEDQITDLVAGAVGEGIAVKFMAHRKISGKLPKASEVLSGKVTELATKEISAQYALATELCYELQDQLTKTGGKPSDEWHKMADLFFKFTMDNFTTELTVMACRVAMVTYNLPFIPGKLTNFKEWHKKYGKYIVAAAAR